MNATEKDSQPASERILAFQPLITAVDAARLLNLHPVTILRWCREGRLPHLRLGRKVMFRESDLDSWCTQSSTKPAVCAA
jgi:excisionase family DNA binding protein